MATMSTIVDEAIEEISDELRDISLKIHSNPELCNQEHFAHKTLTDYLESKGFSVTRGAYGLATAFRAEWESPGGGGRTVSFNSEYDALPEIGHGCGHNLIAISGVGALIGVTAAMKKQNIAGKVVLFGTPAEEGEFGKIDMIEAGAYKDVDICIMVHPGWLDSLEARYLACVSVYVEYFGEPAHASAAPWDGKNALDAIVTAYNSLALLRQQTLPTNRLHGIIQQGGSAVNVIPDYTRGRFIIRSRKRDKLAELRRKVQPCFESAANATGCRVKIKWEKEAYDVVVNQNLAETFMKHMKERGVEYPNEQNDLTNPSASLGGSTDMGNVSYEVPSIHAAYDIGTTSRIHTPDFQKAARTEEAHSRTIRASKCLALTALDVLVDDALFKRVHDEFNRVNPKL